MADKHLTQIEPFKPFSVEPQTGGGFLLTQHFDSDEDDDQGRSIYVIFKKAFSSYRDLIEYLDINMKDTGDLP